MPDSASVQEGRHGNRVPLRAGMFTMPEDGSPPRLIGCRCAACGETFFPRRAFCAHCSSDRLEDVLLSRRGTIHTYTIVRQQLPGSAMTPPYAIVNVRLPEGVTVQSVMTDCDPADVRIGQEVEVVVRKIMENEAGEDVVNFLFRPAGP